MDERFNSSTAHQLMQKIVCIKEDNAKDMLHYGDLAQLVEQETENLCVPSSILGVATKFKEVK